MIKQQNVNGVHSFGFQINAFEGKAQERIRYEKLEVQFIVVDTANAKGITSIFK